DEAFAAVGVAAEWIAPVRKAGYATVAALAGAVPGKLVQELIGINKKFKLGLKSPQINDLSLWVENAKSAVARISEGETK
ncbi:MAG: DUF4332 domain-containing protein, partial [Muribaculaceae bacterium]|nr:DUF4332 domain-containing protein [Muribaculaceae bacterium]